MSGASNSGKDRPASQEKDKQDASELQKRIDDLLKQKAALEKMDDKGTARFSAAQKLRNDADQIKRDMGRTVSGISSDIRARMQQQLDGMIDSALETINSMRGGQQGIPSTRQNISLLHSTPIGNGYGVSPFGRRTANVRDVAGESQENAMQELLRAMGEIKELQLKKDADLNSKLDRFDARLSDLNGRFDSLENKVGRQRMESPEPGRKQLQTMGQDVSLIKEQLTSVQGRFDGINNRIDNLLVQMNQRPTSPVAPQVIQVHLTGQIPQQIGGPSSQMMEGTSSKVSSHPEKEKVVHQKAPVPIKSEPQDQKNTTSQVAPSATASSTSTSSNPMVVNVPKTQQRDSSALDRLMNTAPCSPSVVPEVKGTGTVSWGASTTHPSKPTPSQAARPQSPSSSMPPLQSSQPSSVPSSATADKPRLFEQFAGFGAPTQSSQQSTPMKDQKPGVSSLFGGAAASSAPFSSLFGGLPSSSIGGNTSFAALASSVPSSGFNKSDKAFAGTGAKLFGSSTTKPATKPAEGDDEEGEVEESPEGFVPNVDYQPIVTLPEVKVTTGEEDWDNKFSERAKLFRFEKSTQEWKERGIGDMAIQQQKGGKLVFRILMRYEKTLKICANHRIHPSMNLQPFSETDKKTVRWTAQDFADNEPKMEMLAVRFKTPEIAEKFKQIFDDAKKQTEAGGDSGDKKPPPPPEPTKSASAPLSDLFKSAAGSWDCPGCYCNNPGDKTVCPACSTPKPDTAAPAASSALKSGLFGGATLNLGSTSATGGFSFGGQQKPAESKPLFGGAGTSSASTTSTPVKTETGLTKAFAGFGLNKPAATKPEASSSATGGFSFGQPAASGGFSFNFASPVPSSAPKPAHKDDEDEDSDNDPEAYEPGGQYAPVVTLPENVQLSTGEENEVCLYSQRAKLYRFTENEWKERGLGDLRMLKEKNGNKIRLVMRREKILKLCLNHYIKEGMNLRPMPSTKNAWMWDALDFSEMTTQHETFAAKFKHEAHVKEFKELFDRCKQISSSQDFQSVEKFERVAVDENEAMLPIAESGKKAIQAMSVNNPFGSANKNESLVQSSVKIEEASDTEDSK
ncbi:hypothetical protein RvY_10032-2 [Ramazzottius varieornatus]|uniref:RanBD1 domain-containing protein n=1 Tax=Ramazzottius varieornatus TaxID=947166 RepID=A0A1D1VBF5_RAMVA|nr:hypothetical protein RvY_10032-2 [Ramazzottius varieornatus]